MTYSLCMIVKNEEEVLARCLDSVKGIFDEIIIVDTGSSDETKEIAQIYTDKIYDFEWCDDFSQARNYAFSKATSDYIMWLDADDILKEEDNRKLQTFKKNMKDVDVVMMPYHIAFDKEGKPTFSYYRERLLKRSNNFKWHDSVHEYLEIYGNIITEEIAITHKKEKNYTNRNLKIYEKMEKEHKTFTPRNLYYYGRELMDHQKYTKAKTILKKFLKTNGWIEDKINACLFLYQITDDLSHLWRTFEYDIPRSKTCYYIANHFLKLNDYQKAIYWYEFILNLPKQKYMSFYEEEYEAFFPALQLCLCYYQNGDIEKAYFFHQLCKKLKPYDDRVLYNDLICNKKTSS